MKNNFNKETPIFSFEKLKTPVFPIFLSCHQSKTSSICVGGHHRSGTVKTYTDKTPNEVRNRYRYQNSNRTTIVFDITKEAELLSDVFTKY